MRMVDIPPIQVLKVGTIHLSEECLLANRYRYPFPCLVFFFLFWLKASNDHGLLFLFRVSVASDKEVDGYAFRRSQMD